MTADPSVLIRAPLQVTWSITHRCNLSCAYCLEDAAAADAPADGELSHEGRLKILDEFVRERVLQVYLSGGEPLLVSELDVYARRLSDAGISVKLTTNGVLLDAARAAALAEAGVRTVEISRHPGAERRAADAANASIAAGIRTVMRVVVTPGNAEEIPRIVDECAAVGLQAILFQEVMPMGRGLVSAGAAPFTVEALNEIAATVNRLAAEYPDERIEFGSVTLADAALGCQTPCQLSRGGVFKSCEIRPDGNLIPCSPAIIFGVDNNVLAKGLSQAWREIPDLYRAFVSRDPGGGCTGCEHLALCRGGCRALAVALAGGAGRGNPGCQFAAHRTCE